MLLSPNVPLRWQALQAPQDRQSADEIRHACAGNPETARFAIAAGIEGAQVGRWSKLLADGFIRPKKADHGLGWVEPIRQELPAERGAASSSFCGLVLRQGTFTERGAGGAWSAIAVGACCLFHVRGDRLLKAFPVGRAAQLEAQSSAIASRAAADPRFHKETSAWRGGDHIYLMTPSLARWFLLQHEKEQQPWLAIQRAFAEQDPPSAFASWVQTLREAKEIAAGDVAVLPIELLTPA